MEWYWRQTSKIYPVFGTAMLFMALQLKTINE